MPLYRTIHDKNNPYVTVNKTIVKDRRLSWRAKGIWLYAFSRPDDWQFYTSDIINQSIDGEKSVRAGLKELMDCGYLVKNQGKNEKGQYECADWNFFETPKSPEEIKEMFPQAQKGKTAKEPLLIKEEINKETTTTYTISGPVAAPSKPVIAHKEYAAVSVNPSTIESVAVFPCLDAVEIDQLDKVWISSRYGQEEVKNAVLWASHPETKINSSLAAAIKWACKAKPVVPQSKQDKQKENREFTKHREGPYVTISGGKVILEALNNKAHCYPAVGNCEGIEIEYTENGFVDQLMNALRKFGVRIGENCPQPA